MQEANVQSSFVTCSSYLLQIRSGNSFQEEKESLFVQNNNIRYKIHFTPIKTILKKKQYLLVNIKTPSNTSFRKNIHQKRQRKKILQNTIIFSKNLFYYFSDHKQKICKLWYDLLYHNKIARTTFLEVGFWDLLST